MNNGSNREPDSWSDFLERLSPQQKRELRNELGVSEDKPPETPSRHISTLDVQRANSKFDHPAELFEDTYNGLLASKGVPSAKTVADIRHKNNVAKAGTSRRENVQAIRKVPGDMQMRRELEESETTGE